MSEPQGPSRLDVVPDGGAYTSGVQESIVERQPGRLPPRLLAALALLVALAGAATVIAWGRGGDDPVDTEEAAREQAADEYSEAAPPPTTAQPTATTSEAIPATGDAPSEVCKAAIRALTAALNQSLHLAGAEDKLSASWRDLGEYQLSAPGRYAEVKPIADALEVLRGDLHFAETGAEGNLAAAKEVALLSCPAGELPELPEVGDDWRGSVRIHWSAVDELP